MNQKAQELVDYFGNQAYHMAVHFTVVAEHLGDTEGAKMFADAGIDLMQAWYHKYPKEEGNERRVRGSDEVVRDERGGPQADASAPGDRTP